MADDGKKKSKNDDPVEEPLAIIPLKIRKVTEGVKMNVLKRKTNIKNIILDKDIELNKDE